MKLSEIDLCTVSYQTQLLVRRQLECLNQDGSEHSWMHYIADNGSTDGSVAYLEKIMESEDWIDHLTLQDNVGYGKACNYLASLGTSPIIGLLNADVWLSGEDVNRIVQFFEDHPEAAIMGPKQRDERNLVRHGGIVGSNTAPRHRGWNEFDPDDILYRDMIECVTVSGSAYFIRRSVWDELTQCQIFRQAAPDAVGAFLPTPHYYDETACSYHATAHGHKIIYSGEISIGHSFHASHPVGSPMDAKFNISKAQFNAFCDLHRIPHD